MSSVIKTFQKRTSSLPVSQPDLKDDRHGLRRRLSSLSLKIQPSFPSSGGAAAAWALRRSKSISSLGESTGNSIRKWWDWGWGWILSRKPSFAGDLEMNEEETAMLGSQSRGSWRHVFYKVRSEFRKLFGADNVGLPQTFRYDSFNYAQNFEDAKTRSFRS